MDLNKISMQLQAYGFNVKSSELKFDKWTNCKLIDNKSGKSGGYIINTKLNLCSYKNHKTMETGGFPLDREKVFSNHNYIKAIKENQRMERDKYYQNAQNAATKYNNTISTDLVSPYLERKQVQNFGCKINQDGDLLIPLRSMDVKEDGRRVSWIRTVQTIKADGTKLLESGCEKKGAMHLIGFNKIFQNPEKYQGAIMVAEGYATAASIHMASGLPTVVAIDAGNLDPVMAKITKAYPNSEFYICADNDLKTEKKIGRNVGIEAAMQCKEKYNCKVMIPDFSKVPNNENLTDFNDLHIAVGLNKMSENSKVISDYQPISQKQSSQRQEEPTNAFIVTKTTTSSQVLDYYSKINPKYIEAAKELGWITYKEPGFTPKHTPITADPKTLAEELGKITGKAVEIESSLNNTSNYSKTIT